MNAGGAALSGIIAANAAANYEKKKLEELNKKPQKKVDSNDSNKAANDKQKATSKKQTSNNI